MFQNMFGELHLLRGRDSLKLYRHAARNDKV